MILSITSIQLKSFWSWPKFLKMVRIAERQAMKDPNCLLFRTSISRKTHYTMSIWVDAIEMHRYVKSGAHQLISQKGKHLSEEIRVIHFEADELISWKEAKKLVQNGRKAYGSNRVTHKKKKL